MKGKFGTKTIVIIALIVVLLAIGVTGTVLFLKDSGEASAIEETNRLPVTGLDNNQQTEEDEKQEGVNENQTSEVTQANANTQPAQSNENTTTQNGTNGETTAATAPTQSTRTITQEPETSTVEREKVIAESTKLNWNKFNLSGEDYTEKDINYNNLKYKVEYYFDEELNEELTETVLKNKKGQIIDTYNDKVKQGYGLERTENLPLTISEIEENNVIKVYYAKQEFKYVVNYYKDEISEATFLEKEEAAAEFGSTVTADVTKYIPEGYKFVGEAPSIEISTEENVINVVYVKDSFGYRVEYYYDGTKDDSKTETGTAEFGIVIDSYTDKAIDGYKLDKTENKPLTITTNAENNVIKVYYVKRTDLSYMVKYYYNGQEAVEYRKEIPNQTFGAEITADDIIHEYSYNNETYELKEYTTEQGNKKLPLTIQTNTALNIINVYYVKPIIEVSKTSKAYKACTGEEIAGTNIHEKDEIEYKITISNRGLGNAGSITVTDPIDLTKLEIKNIIIDNQEQQIPQSGIVTWTGRVPAASEQTITIRVSVKTLPKDSNGTTINKNKVYLNGDIQNPIEDPNEYTVLKANINTEKSSKAYTSSNVEIQKTEPKTKLHVGDLIEYTIKVWNTGNEQTTVKIKDEAPDGTIYKEGDLTKEVYVPANTKRENAITMTFKVEVTQDGLGKTIKNIATVEVNESKEEPKDPTEYVVIGYSDIVVTKTMEDKYKTVKYGNDIEYIITAENKGEEAGNVIIKDEDLQTNVNNGNLTVKSIKVQGNTITTSKLATGVELNVLPDSKVQIKIIATAKAPIGSIISNTVKYVPDGKEEKTTPAVETKVEKEITATNLVGQKTNIVILYDRSASMWEGGKDDKAKEATCSFIDSVFNKEGAVGNTTISVIGFTDEMGDPEVGVVKFGNNLSTATTINEKNQLKTVIKGLSSDGDYTYIKPGLDIAKELIPTLPNYSTANNMIVIMTDGKLYDVDLYREYSHSQPSGIEGEAVPSRDALRKMGVKIYAVGFGLSYLSSDYNEEEEQEAKDILKFFADKSYTAETQNELLNSYKNILLEASVSNMLSSDGKVNISLGDKIKNIKIYKNGVQLNATFKVNYSGNNVTVTTTTAQYKEIAGDITIKDNVLTWDLSGTLYKDWNNIKITYEY